LTWAFENFKHVQRVQTVYNYTIHTWLYRSIFLENIFLKHSKNRIMWPHTCVIPWDKNVLPSKTSEQAVNLFRSSELAIFKVSRRYFLPHRKINIDQITSLYITQILDILILTRRQKFLSHHQLWNSLFLNYNSVRYIHFLLFNHLQMVWFDSFKVLRCKYMYMYTCKSIHLVTLRYHHSNLESDFKITFWEDMWKSHPSENFK